jgi:hypothetical protein
MAPYYKMLPNSLVYYLAALIQETRYKKILKTFQMMQW